MAMIAFIMLGLFGGYLEEGENLLNQGKYQEAIERFELAANSKDSIPPIIATAYWNEHLAYAELKDYTFSFPLCDYTTLCLYRNPQIQMRLLRLD